MYSSVVNVLLLRILRGVLNEYLDDRVLLVATAPNAIVFGSGYMTIPQMAKIGFVITLPAILVISAFAIWWIPIVWT